MNLALNHQRRLLYFRYYNLMLKERRLKDLSVVAE
jgi:hypothetical protein